MFFCVILALSEGESRAAKREPDRAKHQIKARQGVCSITQTTRMQKSPSQKKN